MQNKNKIERDASPNESQLQAIHTAECPLLIIAGPGSGKTFTLVERAFCLIAEKKVPPENILISTFTEKAAREIITRLSNKLLENNLYVNLHEMYIGTMHSIFLRILEENKEATHRRDNLVFDDFDQKFFVYNQIWHIRAKFPSIPVFNHSKPRNWQETIELVKLFNTCTEEAIDSTDLMKSSDSALIDLGKAYRFYLDALKAENAYDFAVIQRATMNLFKEHPEVLNQMQEKIKYLMIDEYQDTNTIQEILIFLLIRKHSRICVVGDDDQALYRFRGASVQNILEFPKRFMTNVCSVIKLETNYRSHPKIIDFFSDFIAQEEWQLNGTIFRHPKKIHSPVHITFPAMKPVLRVMGNDEDKWHQELLSFIRHLQQSGIVSDLNQIAFLFRSLKGDKVIRLIKFFEENGIPVYAPRSDYFFKRTETRLFLGAILSMFPQYRDIRQWNDNYSMDIWNYYDEACLEPFVALIQQTENSKLLEYCRNRAYLFTHLAKPTDLNFTHLVYELLQFPLMAQFVENEKTARNVAILTQLLTRFEHFYNISVITPKNLEFCIKHLFNIFFHFLKQGGINEYEDEEEYAPSGCISFLTIHQAKGLEFPIVCVGSLHTSPRKDYDEFDVLLQDYYRKKPFEPIDKIKYYDFRRLFYTAFSRAQNLLVLTDVEKEGRGKTPSKHFDESYSQTTDWKAADLNPDLIRLKPIKDVNIKKEYSFNSHINLFETCPRQYQFLQHLEFSPSRRGSMLFGTLVHQSIEDIHKHVLKNGVNGLHEAQITDWFETNYKILSTREKQYLSEDVKQAAHRQVINYFQRNRNELDQVREAEVSVSLVKKDYILKGTIDLIKGKGNTVEIIDFKSEAKPDVSDVQSYQRYQKQLEMYAHIVEERHGLNVSQMHLYYTGEGNGNPLVTFEKNQRHIDQTMQEFDGIVNRIENKDFQISQRPKRICRSCDLRFYCDFKGCDMKN
ncbi:MAG: ATP-dependent helicase [bacterium]|nr:ATP-dependent helicase [bacterium]